MNSFQAMRKSYLLKPAQTETSRDKKQVSKDGPQSFDDLKERLLETSQIHKTLIYGDRDDEYIYFADVKKLNLSNLTLFVIEGADHEFRGMLEEYIALMDLIN